MAVVIEGIGIISPVGLGRAAFWKSLYEGRHGFTPIGGIDVSAYGAACAGEVKDFDPGRFVTLKNLRYVNRGTKLLAAATQLAIEDAGLELTASFGETTGIVIGSGLGNFPQTTDYLVSVLQRGPRDVTPMESYDVALNASTNYVSVHYRLKAFARTIASGFTSGLEAIGDAADALGRGRATKAIAGGVEQLSYDLYLPLYWQGHLAGARAQAGRDVAQEVHTARPFDRNRQGMVLGEGAYVVIVGRSEDRRAGGGPAYAEVAGHARGALGRADGDDDLRIRRVNRVMRESIARSGLTPGDIDLVVASANGSKDLDRIEAQAIRAVCGDVAVTAPKSLAGECYGAGGALLTAVAALAMREGTVPETANVSEVDPECPVALVRRTRRWERPVRAILVNCLDPLGNAASLVLKRPAEAVPTPSAPGSRDARRHGEGIPVDAADSNRSESSPRTADRRAP